MPRKKSPDGKRVPMSTRFSEPEAAAVDADRGGTDRSEWLRAAALAFLAAKTPRQREAKPATCPHRLPSGTYCKDCGRTKA